MHTEASHRFERGADPEAPPAASARIAHLAEKIGAGTTRPGLIDRYVRPSRGAPSSFRRARATALLGAPVAVAEARRILTGLGFARGRAGERRRPVEVPTWRGDVSREVDLVEEVGRHQRLDRIPSTIPPGGGRRGAAARAGARAPVREVLAGAGLDEVITYSFVPAARSRSRGARPAPTR